MILFVDPTPLVGARKYLWLVFGKVIDFLGFLGNEDCAAQVFMERDSLTQARVAKFLRLA